MAYIGARLALNIGIARKAFAKDSAQYYGHSARFATWTMLLHGLVRTAWWPVRLDSAFRGYDVEAYIAQILAGVRLPKLGRKYSIIWSKGDVHAL